MKKNVVKIRDERLNKFVTKLCEIEKINLTLTHEAQLAKIMYNVVFHDLQTAQRQACLLCLAFQLG